MRKYKMTKKTKYDVHNTTQKTKDCGTLIPQKGGANRCIKRWNMHTGASKGETCPAPLVTSVVYHVSL